MNNLEIREFSQAIINFTNGSPLPIEVKRLAVEGVLRQLEDAADAEIKAELKARQEEEAQAAANNAQESQTAANNEMPKERLQRKRKKEAAEA